IYAYFGQPVMVDGQAVVTPRISAVQPGGAGAAAGFRAGDVVTSVDGEPIESFSKFQRVIAASADKLLHIAVLRDKQETVLTATPTLTEIEGANGKVKVGRLGLNSSADFRDMMMRPCTTVEAD